MVPARVEEILSRLKDDPAGKLESKVLEFKSWCKNLKDLSYEIAEAAVCLSNAEGGLVIIGVDDKKAGLQGLKPCPYPSLTVDWVKKVIRDLTKPPVQCNVAKSTDLIPGLGQTPCRDLFIVDIAKTQFPSGHRTNEGIAYVRVDTECRTDYITDEDDYTKLWFESACISDLNDVSLQEGIKTRESAFAHLRHLGHRPIDHLLETGLLRLRESAFVADSDALIPSIGALLFFGNGEMLKKEFSSAGTVLAIERTISEPVTSWYWLNIADSISTFLPLIQGELRKKDAELPDSVTRELLINAYVHRCYRTSGAIHIRIGQNEIEIQNPGGLLGELTADTLLYSTPIYRNFALADAVRQFGYCEKAGTGIDKVYYSLLIEGLDFPFFTSVGNSFSVIIKTKRDIPFAKLIKHHAGQLNLTINDLIVMRTLRTRVEANIEYLSKLTQRTATYMESTLVDLERRKIVERIRQSRYRLSDSVLNQIAKYDDERQGTLF